jgi:hypothetical protein
MLGKVEGVKGDKTPCSVSFATFCNPNSKAAQRYIEATGKSPEDLLQGGKLGRYIIKQAHKTKAGQFILTFQDGVLNYLSGVTSIPPGNHALHVQ